MAPMLQQLLTLLPTPAPAHAGWVCGVGCAGGTVLWLGGSRFSRSLITLLMVGLGTWCGKSLPHWLGWNVSEMTPGVAGAIVFGVAAYVLHRFFAAVALALVLCGWAAALSWALAAPGSDWSWPAWSGAGDFVTTVWGQLTPHAREVLPWTCAAALVAGFGLAMFAPRVGTIVLHAIVGTSFMLGFGAMWMNHTGRAVTPLVPGTVGGQFALLAGWVAVGAAVQWRLAPRVKLIPARAAGDGADESGHVIESGQASPA
jgi:hypothetical protein